MNKEIIAKQGTGKIVVLGGSGLIGGKLVRRLRELGADVVGVSKSSGVDSVSGEGLATAFAGAGTVVDVTNSPSFEAEPVMAFFRASATNIAAAEKIAGVKHHVALSVVGTDRLPDSGYFRAKLAQEKIIRESGVPYSIVRATQFFEFVGAIAQAATSGNLVRSSSAMMQPILSDDVVSALLKVVMGAPLNNLVDLAGPEPIRMDELIRQFLAAQRDTRTVVTDDRVGYFGAPVDDHSLTPGANPLLGSSRFSDWLRQNVATN